MKMTKTGKDLFAMSLLLAVMASTGICQTNQGGQPKNPSLDFVAGSPAYYTYDNNTHILSVTNGVYLCTNMSGSYSIAVGWYLSADNEIATADNFIGSKNTRYFYPPSLPSADTLTLTVDLDTIAGLSLTNDSICYVGTIVNYSLSGEIAADSANYVVLYTNNIWCSADSINFRNDTLKPTITYANPDSGTTGILPDVMIKLGFSEPMDTTTFAFTILPNPGGLGRTWNNWRDTVSLIHATFAYTTVETVSVTNAQDQFGNPLTGRNVITFTTVNYQGPTIAMKTQPSSPQTIGRPYLVQTIITDLEIKTGKSVTAESLYCRVNNGLWSGLGAGKVTGDTFSFWIPAIDSGIVEYYIQAWDNVGDATIEPSSGYHSFNVNTLPPVITYSTPDSGATNILGNAVIKIAFSAPLDTASYTFTMIPDPGGINGTWNMKHDTLSIAHNSFSSAVVETIKIVYAVDPFGHSLSGRSVITFTTENIDLHWDDRFGTSGFNNTINAVATDSLGNIYVGGAFTTAGGVSANRIAKWDGTSWTALGSGMNGTVTCLAVSGTTVFAGGSFTTAGGVTVSRIAKWDGISWSALGTGTNSNVYALAINGNDLYAGGSFTTAGGVSVGYIAKWNGTSWSALSSGTNYTVYTLAINGNDLYAGGTFSKAGGISVNNIAKWDGISWSALGSWPISYVRTFGFKDNSLYAAGEFITPTLDTLHLIAKWDGAKWSALGNGMNGRVYVLALHGGYLYAGGEFTTVKGVGLNYIAQWDGFAWSSLGSGTDKGVYALATSDTCLNVGGAFATAGGKASVKFGMYHYFTSLPSAIELSSFTCQAAAGAVTLSWSTESETGNCAWLIERSEQPEGGYNHIATIPAAGSTPSGQEYDYTDNAVKPGNTYYYRLGDQDLNGTVTWHGPVSTSATGAGTITALSLLPCKPNPFSSNTTISYLLPKAGQVSLKVYNIAGQAVKTLVEETQSQGAYNVSWDGLDERGRAAQAGVYFYRLNAAGANILRKLVLVK